MGGTARHGAERGWWTTLILYVLFAVVATVANLGAQRVVLWVGDGLGVPVWLAFLGALVAGTLAGFAVKYVLDRRWIFGAAPLAAADEAKRVGKYGLTAIGTTLIFWATEAAFWLAYGTDIAREIGAVIGLAIGYTIKYRLDRAYVFTEAKPAGEGR